MARTMRAILANSSDQIRIVRNEFVSDIDHFLSFAELYRRSARGYEPKGKKVITTIHHLDKRRKHRHFSHLFESCSAICVVSNQWKKHLIEVEGISHERVHVIYNGIPSKESCASEGLLPMEPVPLEKKEALRKEFGIPLDAFVVGHIGRDDPRKGVAEFSVALDKLGKAVFPIYFEDCSDKRGKSGLMNVGYSRFRDIYNIMDLYVISASIEGGPVGYIEAMACEIPVISTRVGMPVDFHPDIYLCDIGASEQLAERISFVKDNYQDAVKKTVEIRSDLSWLTWDSCGKAYADLYAKI